jgi:hypothetical protein
MGDGLGAGGAGGIRGTRAEGGGERATGVPKGINDLSRKVLKIRMN